MLHKSFDDRDGFIWMNGNIIAWRDAQVHVMTHALHYGSAVFEGERAYRGKIFRVRDHSQRLYDSARMIGMTIPYSLEELDKAKYETLESSDLKDAYIRTLAWRGSEQMGIGARNTKTHVMIAVWDWPSYFSPELLEKGINLTISQWRKPSPETAPVQSKAAGLYIINTLSKHAAEEAGFDDALMCDWRGNPVEATGANLFIVKNGILRTPKADCFLNGITRLTVIDLAHSLQIPFEENTITMDDLRTADEVFLTGTAAEITSVGRIDDVHYNVGNITRTLRDAYAGLVRR